MGSGMRFIETPLKGLYIVEAEPFVDERGMFFRVFCKNEFAQIGCKKEIVQASHSLTRNRGTIRGLHFQAPPVSEAKIVRCVAGAVYDVVVDVRADSPTFLQSYGIELSKDNMKAVCIPEGFAHGFQTIEDNAELIYHHTAFYDPLFERGLRFNDSRLSICWPLEVSFASEKDRDLPLIEEGFGGVQI
jgi:dTDP-4-dehydrorhamnose 3,5-epimerase